MTDLAKSYIFNLILYREDKLIILGINFDQYLIFFFGTGFVCIVDQGSNNLDQMVFGNAGNDFFVPHADIGPDIFRRTDNFTVDKSCQDFIADLQKGEILPAVIFSGNFRNIFRLLCYQFFIIVDGQMHIQDCIQMIVKFMLFGTDFFDQFFQRNQIVLIKPQFIFLLAYQYIITSPVHNSPDHNDHHQNKHDKHPVIKGTADQEIHDQID